MSLRTLFIASVCAGLAVAPALAENSAGRDACIQQLRKVGGPDAANGVTVLTTAWSQAGTLVTMRDAGGSVWSCIGYDDGTVADLKVVNAADDGNGAMAGSSGSSEEVGGTTTTQRVRFMAGTSGATYDASLTPGSSRRYVLGARKGQFLTVTVDPSGPDISYQIFNPDGSFLLDMIGHDKPYRGQLWQSGDHVIEVINRGHRSETYNVEFRVN